MGQHQKLVGISPYLLGPSTNALLTSLSIGLVGSRVLMALDISAVMVPISEALAILSLATNDRMTPQRLWKMSMCEGRPIEGACWRSFVGIDYYSNIRDPRTEFLDETPGFPGYMWAGYDESTMQELEELGDSEIIRNHFGREILGMDEP